MTPSDSRRDRQEKKQRPDDKRSEPTERSLINRPTDPNRTGADKQIPPGISSEDLHDPGNTTPDAPPVDNRS